MACQERRFLCPAVTSWPEERRGGSAVAVPRECRRYVLQAGRGYGNGIRESSKEEAASDGHVWKDD